MTETDPLDLGKCQCCERNPAVGVAAIPGIAMSIAWCGKCLEAGAIPYWVAVANTAMIGGWSDAAPWWTETVEDTLRYFGKDFDEFLQEVEEEKETQHRLEMEQMALEEELNSGTADRPGSGTEDFDS